MLFLGIILIVTDNINTMTKSIETEIEVWVPVKQQYEAQIDSIESELISNPDILAVSYISKDEALGQYIEENQTEAYDFLIGEENPMLDAFIITVQSGDVLSSVVDDLNAAPWPNEVRDGGEATSMLLNSLESLRFGGTILVVALLILAIFLISNTIKLSIHSRQDEIEIMRIVGATNSFIRSPFLIEGLLIGLIGSIIPILVVILGYNYLINQDVSATLFSVITLNPVYPLVQNIALILLGTSLIVGLIGSYISVTKHLRWTR
jgi:cell division transport system permease protein